MDQDEALAPVRSLASTNGAHGRSGFPDRLDRGVWHVTQHCKPVRQLVQGAEKIGQGNLDTRIEVKSGDEIGQLGIAFNEMAVAIGEKENQLRLWAKHPGASAWKNAPLNCGPVKRAIGPSRRPPRPDFRHRPQDNVQYVNTLAARQFGKNPEQVTGKTRSEFPAGTGLTTRTASLQQVFKIR